MLPIYHEVEINTSRNWEDKAITWFAVPMAIRRGLFSPSVILLRSPVYTFLGQMGGAVIARGLELGTVPKTGEFGVWLEGNGR
jgi:hypothetical protein